MHAVLLPSFSVPEIYSDSRGHGHQGPTRNVRIPRVASNGGGAIAMSEDGVRCVVAGKESLRILRLLQPSQSSSVQPHKTSIGRGGYRIEASRSFWDGSGLKIDSASTDVAWGHGNLSNKIVTSARNGEFIMWDINKSTPNKYERRSKLHTRSINKISMSQVVQHYCITGSSDGDLRVWDLRDTTKSLMKIHHPISVRSVVFSPILWQPLQAVVGLDNGSIYRWDLKMGQRGQLDRLPMAHSGPIMTLDWCPTPARPTQSISGTSDNASTGSGLGWLASGGLDRSVKVWNLTAPNSQAHIPHKPTYSLHPAFPVRRVVWRPSYECELAIVSNEAFGTGSNHDLSHTTSGSGISQPRGASSTTTEAIDTTGAEGSSKNSGGDPAEIWDVRRRWIAKWSITGSAAEGGLTDLVFADPHTIWTQHSSGTFSQIDLRGCTKPIDAVSRVAVTWEASGSLAFVSDRISQWEIPYDDTKITTKQLLNESKVKIKAIGDSATMPQSQSMGAYSSMRSMADLDIFTKLARSYTFEGNDRNAICRHNAHAAFQVGKDEAAHFWLFLGSLLTEFLPGSPKPERDLLVKEDSSSSTQPITPLSAVASTYSFPPRTDRPKLTSTPSEINGSRTHMRSNSRTSSPSLTPDMSSSRLPRRVTPSSSATSSPRYATSSLPPFSQRNPSQLGKREPGVGFNNSHRRQSVHRRPSVSVISASPGDKSTGSLRHVGEGALGDSDSSEEDGENGDKGDTSSGEDNGTRLSESPQPGPPPASPISVGRQLDEERRQREGVLSLSPRSSDTESSTVESPVQHPRSLRRNSGSMKSRSRSSTVASLAATSFRPSLVKQESRSSIRTVLAADLSSRNEDRSHDSSHSKPDIVHARQASQPILPGFLLSPEVRREPKAVSLEHARLISNRRPDIVRADEKRFRELGWEVFRDQLETFADEGDIQMCAMLSLVASKETHFNQTRVTRFLESYIELLTRHRLYTSAAHLRRYSGSESLRTLTGLETTLYTLCGRCRKPFSHPTETSKPGHNLKGGYSYCRSCRSYPAKCAICRLPVRTMMFNCSVCRHGGHRECYVRYYMARPMVDMPSSVLSGTATRGRIPPTFSLSGDVGSDDDNVTVADSAVEGDSRDHHAGTHRISGHPCAAGCGHICWAANGMLDFSL